MCLRSGGAAWKDEGLAFDSDSPDAVRSFGGVDDDWLLPLYATWNLDPPLWSGLEACHLAGFAIFGDFDIEGATAISNCVY
jgi:hypothetical protein